MKYQKVIIGDIYNWWYFNRDKSLKIVEIKKKIRNNMLKI